MTDENKNEIQVENRKKSVWDIILKVVIAAVSALAGALGANAMNL